MRSTNKYGITGMAIVCGLLFASCEKKSFQEINKDPNKPASVPTTTLIISAEKQIMDNLRNETISLAGSMLFAQYFSQNIYTDPSRYDIPRVAIGAYWDNAYKALNNLEEIIQLNTDPVSKARVTAGGIGSNETQIAVARVLKAFTFQVLTDMFGNIPYQSYGNKDPEFQALQRDPEILKPVYASQEKIYTDLLKELQAAGDTLLKYNTLKTFGNSDFIYKGSNGLWARFANSLRLRVAMRIRNKMPGVANGHFADALTKGVFENNGHNAVFKYQATAPNQAPLYRATVAANRQDFAVSHVLINLLKGTLGPVGYADPRLAKYARPNAAGQYVGQPYGLGTDASSINKVGDISLPGEIVNAPDYGEVLQEYAEVAFLISEYNGFSQAEYEKGVAASLQKWGVDNTGANDYIAHLPAADAKNVLTQKYLALYMQGNEAWSEVRRTGQPDFLVKPGDVVWTRNTPTGIVEYKFQPLFGNGIPKRLYYPIKEQTVNKQNYQQAAQAMQGDDITTVLWWNK